MENGTKKVRQGTVESEDRVIEAIETISSMKADICINKEKEKCVL